MKQGQTQNRFMQVLRYFHKLILKSSYFRSYHSVFENFIVLEIDFQEISGTFDFRRFRPPHDLIMMFFTLEKSTTTRDSIFNQAIFFPINEFSLFCTYFRLFKHKNITFLPSSFSKKIASKLRLCLFTISWRLTPARAGDQARFSQFLKM